MTSHLPQPPAGFDYRQTTLNGDTYTTTGWFNPSGRLTKAELQGVAVLFLDFDVLDWLDDCKHRADIPPEDLDAILAAHLDALTPQLPAPPSALVCSGYGWHVYYHLDRLDYPPAEVQAVNKRLAHAVALADIQVCNPGERLSRPPGSTNNKTANPQPVVLVQAPNTPYTLAELTPAPSKALKGLGAIKTPVLVSFAGVSVPAHKCSLDDLARQLNQGDKLKIACPLHDNASKGSAFLTLDSAGRPFLRCESEKLTYRPDDWAPVKPPIALDLALTEKGAIRKTLLNALNILTNDPRAPAFWLDDRSGDLMLSGKEANDSDLLDARIWIASNYGVEFSKEITIDAISATAKANARNPLIEYFERVEHSTTDPEGLALDWLVWGAGAADTPINRAYSVKFLIAAVARAYDPGCKVDTVLTLVGGQGLRKSSGFEALSPPGFFSDSQLDISNKDAYQQIRRPLVYEISEFASFSKREIEAVKAFITSTADRYREPYGRLVVTRKRQNVFVATTNDATPLSDATGSRRFWSVDIDGLLVSDLRQHRDSIWGAAVRAYKAGAEWWLTVAEERARAEASQAHQRANPFSEVLLARFDRLSEVFTAREAFDLLDIRPADRKRHQRQLSDALTDIGAAKLKRARALPGGRHTTHWIKPARALPYGAEYASPADRVTHNRTKIEELPICHDSPSG
tara:strand:- start:3818 stop:5878 length:2061 start_codon:yes stop_codon:yes gene_type:complete